MSNTHVAKWPDEIQGLPIWERGYGHAVMTTVRTLCGIQVTIRTIVEEVPRCEDCRRLLDAQRAEVA